MASLLVPVVYLVVIVGSLLVFSRIYRKRFGSRTYEPWFPSHPERDTYISLLQQDPPANDALLKAALLRRATADVGRIMRIREDKVALQNLLQKGSIGDDLWNSLLATEKELEGEIMEVINEANSYREQWGQIIFATASEMAANEKLREMFVNLSKAREEAELKYGSKKAVKSPQPDSLPLAATPSASSAAGPSTPSSARSLSPTSTPAAAKLATLSPTATDSESGRLTPTRPATTTTTSSKKSKKRK